jgi:hypothetical protein
MSELKIKLNNGSEVPIDEFITWSSRRQIMLTRPLEEVNKATAKASAKYQRQVVTPKGVFPSITIASNIFGVSRDTLSKYIYNTAIPEFRFLISKPEDKLKEFHKPMNSILNKTSVYVKTPLGIFKSISDAAKEHNVPRHQIEQKIRSKNHPNFHKFESEENTFSHVKHATKKKTVTPLGIFDSKNEARKAHGSTYHMFNNLFKNLPDQYYFIEE